MLDFFLFCFIFFFMLLCIISNRRANLCSDPSVCYLLSWATACLKWKGPLLSIWHSVRYVVQCAVLPVLVTVLAASRPDCTIGAPVILILMLIFIALVLVCWEVPLPRLSVCPGSAFWSPDVCPSAWCCPGAPVPSDCTQVLVLKSQRAAVKLRSSSAQK